MHAHANVLRNNNEEMVRAQANICCTNESRQSLHGVSYVMMAVMAMYDGGDHVWAGNDGHNSGAVSMPVSLRFHLKQRKLTFIVTNYQSSPILLQ